MHPNIQQGQSIHMHITLYTVGAVNSNTYYIIRSRGSRFTTIYIHYTQKGQSIHTHIHYTLYAVGTVDSHAYTLYAVGAVDSHTYTLYTVGAVHSHAYYIIRSRGSRFSQIAFGISNPNLHIISCFIRLPLYG